MRIYISNAFSLSMLDRDTQMANQYATWYPVPEENPVDFLDEWTKAGAEIISIVGHKDTAALFSNILGRKVDWMRATFKFNPVRRYEQREEILLIGQYIGPRLPEGATELPEYATIEWWIV